MTGCSPRRRAVLAAVLATGTFALAACSGSTHGTKGSDSAPKPPPSSPTASAPTSPSSSSTTSTAATVFRATKISGGTVTIAFTPRFVQALYDHGVRTSTSGTARLDGTHHLRVKITGGSATLFGSTAVRSTQLAVTSTGGLVESRSGSFVAVRNLGLATTATGSKTVISAIMSTDSGRTSASVSLLDLTLTRGAVRSSGGATLGSIAATLDPAAARVLDSALHTTVFADYGTELAGTVTLALTR